MIKPLCVMFCTLLICAGMGGTTTGMVVSDETRAEAGSYRMVEVPWELVNQCGHQPYSDTSQAFCWAYCRIILDGTAHKYTEFWTGSAAVSPLAAGFHRFARTSSQEALFDILQENIDRGFPVVLAAMENTTPDHFVVVVGYRADVSQLTAGDFCILDPANAEIRAGNGDKESYTSLDSVSLPAGEQVYAAVHSGG